MGLQVPQNLHKELFLARHLLLPMMLLFLQNLQFACSLCSYRIPEDQIDQISDSVQVHHHQKKLVIVAVV
jgi:hypothetical protein